VTLDTMLAAMYHDASGATHVLAAPLPELLAALTEPGAIPAILERMGIDDDAEARALLIARMDELRAIGAVDAA
jgi:PqqD family protein of HPr-rel-A system